MKLYKYHIPIPDTEYIFTNSKKERKMRYCFNYNYMIIYFPCFSRYNIPINGPLYIGDTKYDEQISENFAIFLKNLNKYKNEII